REDIKNKIVTLRKKVQKTFKDREQVLKEAKFIAKKMGITTPSLPSAVSDENTPDVMISTQALPEYMRGVKALDAEIESIKERKGNESFINGLRDLERELELLKENPQIIALKNRKNNVDAFVPGLRDLERELLLLKENPRITALQIRKSDDPFITELRGMEEEVDRLNLLMEHVIADTSISSSIIDQHAVVPDHRIKPKRKQIVILGFIIGLMLGLLIAFTLDKIKSYRNTPA
ncbi:MAG: GNVR domain-containing protein, partial [Thermodesulfobacteriota bacterium]